MAESSPSRVNFVFTSIVSFGNPQDLGELINAERGNFVFCHARYTRQTAGTIGTGGRMSNHSAAAGVSCCLGHGGRRLGGEKLGLRELGEAAGARDQFVEGAALDDAAVIEHEDARRVADGRKPVRDHEGGAALHHLVERGLHLALGGGVERARRLVEDQDRRVLQQRARNREALPLAARERTAALADGAVKPVPLDQVVRLRALRPLRATARRSHPDCRRAGSRRSSG